MTKTLTEQWREGILPIGSYYIKLVGDVKRIDFFEGLKWERTKDFGIEEVLASVPSYERIKDLDRLEQFCELILAGEKQEWENIVKRGDRKEMATWLNEMKNKTVDRLEKKLEIATKALKEYERCENGSYAHKALALIKGVK